MTAPLGEITDDRLDQLRRAAGDGTFSTSTLDRARLAHDASHYLLTPRAVLTATSTDQVARAMTTATRTGVPLTFRSGGTSLSGQSVTDGVIVDVRKNLGGIEVLDDGARVRCGPGAVLARVNAALARYGRRLGPDPASEIACTIGGVVSNNSSGMTSGTAATAYRTLESMVLVLPSGTVLDTGAADADDRLRHREPHLYAELDRLREEVRADAALSERIRAQFAMKNTMGYGLNSLLDHDRPVDVLAHLMVGAEGTLGYIAEVTLRTVPALKHVATALCVFDSIDRAIAAIGSLTEAGAVAVELMDASSLRVAQSDPKAVDAMRSLRIAEHTALLVEIQQTGAEELIEASARMAPALDGLALAIPTDLTTDPSLRARMWAVRKALYAAVAGARPQGTTPLLEDIVVPPHELGPTMKTLTTLLDRYGYDDAVTFGHARDANLHFMINPHLDVPEELGTYESFSEDLVDLILGAGGSLKAEHGTGRIMAPFVRRQYGDALYEVMWRIKRACDPAGILNPGSVLSEDPQAHVRHLKTYPAVHPELDRCVECGYCEPVCPSRNVTTTPRQRIVLLRQMANADPERRDEIEREYDYQAIQTCAADSLCVTACPVGIDTGKVMKSFRAESRPGPVRTGGRAVAQAWGPVTAGLRGALGVADALPDGVLPAITRALRSVSGEQLRDWVPQVGEDLPGPGRSRSVLRASPAVVPEETAPGETADLVFFPACIGSLFAAESRDGLQGQGASVAFLRLCRRAGLRAAIPEGIDSLCCGTVWESKGLVDGARAMARRVAERVWALTDGGRLPVVSDASSCTHGLAGIGKRLEGETARRWESLRVVDAVTFTREAVLPALGETDPNRRIASLAVHPTCSTVHLGAVGDLEAVAAATAREVTVPTGWGCCGTAGDRGMLHPELTASATRDEAAEVARQEEQRGGGFAGYASCNRTCEMGMTTATGRPYRHVLELLDEVTAPR